MKAGRLRWVATLKNPSATGDDYSTAGSGFTTVATDIRCEVKYLNGRELIAAKQTGADVSVEIICRYRADITSASRLEVDGVTYEVISPIPVGQRRQDLRLQCKVIS